MTRKPPRQRSTAGRTKAEGRPAVSISGKWKISPKSPRAQLRTYGRQPRLRKWGRPGGDGAQPWRPHLASSRRGNSGCPPLARTHRGAGAKGRATCPSRAEPSSCKPCQRWCPFLRDAASSRCCPRRRRHSTAQRRQYHGRHRDRRRASAVVRVSSRKVDGSGLNIRMGEQWLRVAVASW